MALPIPTKLPLRIKATGTDDEENATE